MLTKTLHDCPKEDGVSQAFGKRNQPAVVKPRSKKKRSSHQAAVSKLGPKFYLYLVGAVLFVVMAGYAFA